MTDLDTTCDAQRAAAARRLIARNNIANIDSFRRIKIATEVDSGVVHVFFIGATDEIAHAECRVVKKDGDIQPDRPDKPRATACCLGDGFRSRHCQRRSDTRNLLCFDRIEFVISAQRNRDQAVDALDDQSFQRLRSRDL